MLGIQTCRNCTASACWAGILAKTLAECALYVRPCTCLELRLEGELMPGPLLTGKLETILVVDDNREVLKVVVAILKDANFNVLSADSGAHAIELAEEKRQIDMLLSDVDMPGMSGPDLGEALKKSRPDLHVMLMSGGRGRESTSAQLRLGIYSEALCGSEAGSNGHQGIALTKPITTWWSEIRQQRGRPLTPSTHAAISSRVQPDAAQEQAEPSGISLPHHLLSDEVGCILVPRLPFSSH